MATGQLRGPANVGGGYLLDLQIPLSGEEGDVLLGEIARDNEGEMDLVRNMVFFKLFLYYFARLSMSLYLSTLFPLSFTLQEQTIRMLLIP